jgi:hypothetical protein
LCKIIFVAIQKTFVVIRQHKNRHPYLQYTNKAIKLQPFTTYLMYH